MTGPAAFLASSSRIESGLSCAAEISLRTTDLNDEEHHHLRNGEVQVHITNAMQNMVKMTVTPIAVYR